MSLPQCIEDVHIAAERCIRTSDSMHAESLGGVQTVQVRGGSGGQKNSTNVPELSVKPITQLRPGLCAGGSSRTNGSRYPPSAHSAAFQGGFNRFINFSIFFTKSQEKSFQNHLPS